jgi:CheY-like chemotaxis protein
VLVVDGHPATARFLAEVLAEAGATPVVVSDLGAARVAVAETAFDAAVADVRLAGPAGVEGLRAALGAVPLVALAPPGVPAADALTRPARPSDLVAALRRRLGRAPGEGREPVGVAVPLCRPLRLLVAEDSTVNQALVLGLLRRQGHSAVVAGNGREALEALGRGHFDAVLLDVQMPEMDGLELAAHIRAAETGERRLPLIALTAHAMKGDREQCLAAGMDYYLTKPVAAGELYRLLADLAGPAECGMRNAECGRDNGQHARADGEALLIPHSAFRIPHSEEIDRAEALACVGGDTALLAQLTELFLTESPVWLAQARSALERGDAAGLRRAAHTLKGAAGHFGAAAAVAAAEELERHGRCGDLAAAAAVLTELERAVERLGPALRGLAAGLPSLEVPS